MTRIVDKDPIPCIQRNKYEFFAKRERLRLVEPGKILHEFYMNQRQDADDLILPHRNAYYAWTMAKEDPELTKKLGRPVTLEEIEVAMYREGMLPAHEYGIPRWFCRKYGFK